MVKFDLDRDSRVTQAVDRLIDMSLSADDGAYLGSEPQLLEALGVSRPTLRQAARLVANDRLIDVRPGQKGGFYAARPDARDTIRAPARFLRLQGATLSDVHSIARGIAEDAAEAACRCSDAGLIDALSDFKATIGLDDTVEDTPQAFVKRETKLASLIARMSGNPVVELFMAIGYSFGLDEQKGRFYQSADDRQRARDLQRHLCDAILAGDGDLARLMTRRRADLIATWLERA